jgi:hypothetical protein
VSRSNPPPKLVGYCVRYSVAVGNKGNLIVAVRSAASLREGPAAVFAGRREIVALYVDACSVAIFFIPGGS